MQRFTQLQVWQRSHGLVLEIYRITQSFPNDERFGVTSQLRRAAVRDLSYARADECDPMLKEADEIARMLNSLRVKVEAQSDGV